MKNSPSRAIIWKNVAVPGWPERWQLAAGDFRSLDGH